MEGDWLRPIPKPCSGADSRSLLPSGCRTAARSHPTADSARTREGARLHRLRGAREPAGRVGAPVAKTTSGSEERISSGRGLWAPSQPSCRGLLLSPERAAGWCPIPRSGPGPPGKGWQERPFLTEGGVAGRSLDPPVRGRGGSTRCPGGFLQTLPLRDHRPHFPSGLASSGARGLREEAGWRHWRGRAAPPRAAGAARAPCALPLPGAGAGSGLSSRCGQSGLCAREGPCAHQSHSHRASCSWLLCCNSGVPVRRGGCSLRPPPPLDWREERPEAAQSGALILMGFLPPHPRTGGLAGQPGASSWEVAVTGSRS